MRNETSKHKKEMIGALWEQKQTGALTDEALATSAGLSVSSLYKWFIRYGFIEAKRNSEEWEEYYEEFLNKNVTVYQIAEETGYSIGTVYNKFLKFGYVLKKREPLDKEALLNDYKNGMFFKELAKKYDRQTIYIRSLLKRII